MENLLFICPECGKVDTIKTKGNALSCTSCNMTFTCNEYGFFENAPFKTMKEYADWQKQTVYEHALKGTSYSSNGGVLKSIVNHEETILTEGKVILTSEELRCGEKSIPLHTISNMAFHGRHALVFSVGKDYYELLPLDTNNVIKYVWLYESYKELNK